MPGNKFRRVTEVGNPTCLLGFSGRDSVKSMVFDSSTITPGGTDEVQTVTITGTPTGGVFKLGYKGQLTADIAFNASAATVQTALRALSRLGSGVTVTGGPGPGTPYVVTFTGTKLGKQEQPSLTTVSTGLTGGTTPAVTVAETTKGSSLDSGLYKLKSGLPLMASGPNKVKEWDGASATTLIGIFDGEWELLGPGDDPIIPVYHFQCEFDKAVVKNWTAFQANYNTWAAANACKFASQGN